ncbi:MAG: ABC transporter substrate-binding protein [Chloroflexi bacterium]|nr:ABC transporter substrate-binding protein [Chloroflexota bacterium]
MKQKLITIGMLLVLLAISACGGGQAATSEAAASGAQIDSSGHITLEFWFALGGDSGKAVEDLVTQFNQSQSDITVNATYQGGYAAMIAKVWSAVSGGGLPAVAQVGAAPLLGSTGSIVAIEDLLAGENGFDRNQIPEVFWDYNRAGGKIWSMPFNQSVPVMFYNRDLFKAAGLDPDAPPQTWDEVIEYGKKLTQDTDGNGAIDQWGFNTAEDNHWYLSAMLLSNGAQIVNAEETEVLYNSPEGVAMLALWGDMVNTYKIMPPNQHNEAKGDFLAGKLGMLLDSSAGIPSMESDSNFDLGVAILPAAGDQPRRIPVGGASLLIFKNANTEIEQAAWTFIQFMVSKESSLFLSTHTGYLPIYASAADWPELQSYWEEHPNRRVPVDQLQFAVAIPEFPALGTSDTELRNAMQAIELNQGDAQTLLDAAKAAVDKSIAEGSSQ